MLEALGVDTSKSFSLIETGEDLVRGDEPSPTRSSVLVRLSHSHIRIGSFRPFVSLAGAGYKFLDKIRPAIKCSSCGGNAAPTWALEDARRAAAWR